MYDGPELFDAYQMPPNAYQMPPNGTLESDAQWSADHALRAQNGFLPPDMDQTLPGEGLSWEGEALSWKGEALDSEAELAQLLATSAPQSAPAPAAFPRPRSHTRRKPKAAQRFQGWTWLRVVSFSLATLTAFVMTIVSVYSVMVSYDPLLYVAAPGVPADLAQGWPLLVFGPWLVASLSILRITLHRRRAPHAWAVVVFFAAIAVALCVSNAPRTLPGIAVAALPPVAALSCFHQFIRQLVLTHPTHPRHTLSRHRAAHRATP